jgi:alkanesulfonate monooxygenase SsuD/methylene tetrahydromethanopterin reductase-like flavin-dependent oxidoreductase (luciferase family)
LGVICRPTSREAAEFTQHIIEHADLGAVGHLSELHARDGKDPIDIEELFRRRGEGPLERRVLARGSYCAIGDPDWVAEQIARLQGIGLDGLAINFVDYLEEFPYFAQEVLPRLERLGLRAKGGGSAHG